MAAVGRYDGGGILVNESSFTRLFNKYLLVIGSRPGPVLNARDAMINNNKTILILHLC